MWWALVVQLVVGAATIGVAFRVGTGNAPVNEQVGTRNTEEAAKARISGRSPRGGRSAGGGSPTRPHGHRKPEPNRRARRNRLLTALLSSDLATDDHVPLAESISRMIRLELDHQQAGRTLAH